MKNKENIWDLLSGRDYHSCIITTYSFDFYYFEKSVIRILRSKGIGNISVFVDSNIFQGVLGKIGNSISRIYSINQIKSKGVFHPKVYMFFGEKKGLLIIGSGNLTSSGHGKNDEVWGAFHFDVKDPKHTQLFANSWAYLRGVSLNTKGFSKEKINWIREFSPWIESLPSPSLTTFEKLDKHSEIAFLSNSSSASIFNQLYSLIRFKEVKELTIVAPYFDAKGKIIEMFRKALPNAEINILVDEDNGVLPFGLSDDVAENVRFYHWRDCSENKNEKSASRLHAKIFNFVLKDKLQYCLFGSANASVAALGGENISAINDEVSILMSSSKLDFLKELNIRVNTKENIPLSMFKKNLDEEDISKEVSTLKYSIEAIDKEGSKLNVYIDKKVESNTRLHLFDSWGDEVYSSMMTLVKNYYSVNLPSNISTFVYGCLLDANTDEVLSNKQIIQDVILLSKTNPDPQKQVLDIIFSDIEQGDELLFAKLIDCISVSDLDIENKIVASRIAKGRSASDKVEAEVKGEVLGYDDFTKVSYDSLQQQYSILNTNSNRIAGFLSWFSRSRFTEEVTSDELDDEELDPNLPDADGREDQPEIKAVTKSAFKKMESSIINFFKRYDKHLKIKVNEMLEKSSQNITNEGEITLNELANFVAALYIAIFYTDKKIEYTENDKLKHDSIIKSFSLGVYFDLSLINIELIGKFLLLCTRGFKKYENEYVNERVEKLRNEAFYNCVFCLVQADWTRTEIVYKNNLMINAIHFLPSDLDKLLNLEQFTKEIKIRQERSANKNTHFVSELKAAIDNFLPRYYSFVDNMELPVAQRATFLTEDLKLGQTVFTSRFGFCNIKYRTMQSEGAILTFSRPGLPWNEKKKDYMHKNWRPFKRNIVY